ncbi:MAG: S16 family serine protease, partial [Devosia sp.]
TSNTLNIPAPLMDRMEIIRLSGYTEEEKFEIARRHLIPETLKENGLEAKEFVISDEILMKVVRDYTREAGVRNLKREISKLMRKSVRSIVQSKSKKVEITPELLEEYLGSPYFRSEKIDADPQVGLVTGLAWTSVGGETLTIEAVMTHGKGRMTVTGNLKEVMKESISAANGYVRSRAVDFGIKPPMFDTRDIHVHVPEGATPKDGPSAGIGMATAIISVMTGIPVRHDVAMTGEITLRGRVLPIGGLKEKLLAALRFGIKKVLIPIDNVRDLKEIPEIVTKGMEIIPVSRMDEVLNHALVRQPEPIEWVYEEPAKAVTPAVPDLSIDGDEAGSIAH